MLHGGDTACKCLLYHWQAVSGQAVDRHLLGLRMLALEAGMEVPELYKDVAYVRSLHFCLSTSQVHKTYIHTCESAYLLITPPGTSSR